MAVARSPADVARLVRCPWQVPNDFGRHDYLVVYVGDDLALNDVYQMKDGGLVVDVLRNEGWRGCGDVVPAVDPNEPGTILQIPRGATVTAHECVKHCP
jgi:hypothetical protein